MAASTQTDTANAEAAFSQTETFDHIEVSSQTNSPKIIATASQTAPLPFEQTHDDPALPMLPNIPPALDAILGVRKSDQLLRKIERKLHTRLVTSRDNPWKPDRFHPPTASLSFDKWIVGYQWAPRDNGKDKAVRGVNFVFSDGTMTTYEPY